MIRNFTCSVYLLFAFFLIHSSLSAQTAYDFAASSGTFTPITGGTAIASIQDDDAISTTIPIGFTFNYFGIGYTDIKVSSNGFISFDVSSNDNANSNFIGSSFKSKLVAPLWDDLSGETTGTASYLLTGTSGNHVLTVEWLNWRWTFNSVNAGISFQVKLYEATGKIEFVYRPEAGALSFASASIGMIGAASAFYSLSNSTASPVLDQNGFDNIVSKPANGQTYSFTPGAAPTTPTVAASSISASAITGTTSTISWTNGNGAYRAVFIKQTSSTSDFFLPVDNSPYHSSSIFGNQYAGSNWYCIYNGTGSSVPVTNLQSTLTYRVQVVEYNGTAGTQLYNTTQIANNFVTALEAPTGVATTVTSLYTNSTEAVVYFQQGNGLRRALFVKATPSAALAPADNATYTANSVFGSGSQVGSSGWFCVYDASISSGEVKITGLSPNTFYYVQAVDYNGSTGSQKYRVAGDNSFATFPSATVPDYTLTPSLGTFTPLVGGTALDAIEGDEANSTGPIGFNFKLGGVVVSNFYASSNGFVSFNPLINNSSGFYNNNLTSSNLRPLLAPFWDDLNGSSGQASYATTGSAPNRIFTLEYLNWKSYSVSAGNASISFQIKLYETTNKIEYIYKQEAAALVNPSASIGLAVPDISGSYSFLSLNNTGSTPAVSSTVETSTISTKPATGQVYAFTPNKLSQTINFGVLPTKTFGDASFTLGATASSGYTVSYTSSNTAVATISGNTVTIVGGGTTTITSNQAGDANYAAAAAVPQQLTVNKKGQTITFAAGPITKVTGDSFDPAATSNSGLAVTYSSSNTAVATVSGTTITAVGVGTADITANQAGNNNYLAATGVVRTLTVNKADQTITFNAIPDLPAQPTAYTLTASSSSGLPITYSSSEGSVATINGNQLTFKGLGGTTITASQAGNANYNAATPVQRQLIVIQGVQTMTFDEIPVKRVGDRSFSVQASASSGLALGFASSNTSVATIVGGQVTIVGEGTTEITVSQSGGLYNPVSATRTLTVLPAKITQTITFAELASKKYGDPDFDLTASSDSQLPVSYASSNTSVATVSGKTVKIVGTGFTTITASQEGDDTYQAAFSIAQAFSVEPGIQTITFDVIPTKTVGDTPFEISAVSSSALPVSLTTSTNKISLVGSQATILKPGSATIRASQPGDANYLAQSKEQTFCINPAKPTIAVTGINTGTPVLTGGNQVNNQWYKDGVAVSTASSFNVTEPGTYTLVVSVDGCSSVPSDPQSFIVTALEDSGSAITVSPNPSQREIRVDLTGIGKDKPVEIVIYDLVGRTLHSSVGSGVVVIDISSFEKGNYVLKATSDSKVIAKQITKN